VRDALPGASVSYLELLVRELFQLGRQSPLESGVAVPVDWMKTS
jgi:hypothetical protein